MADHAGGSRQRGVLGDPYGPRARWLVYASDVCLVGGCASFAINLGRGWSWPLFVWGVIVGLLIPAMSELVRRIASSYMRLTPQQLTEAQPRVRAHRLLVIPGGVATGLGVGLLAGSLMSAWPDVVASVALLLVGLLPALVWLPVIKRKGLASGAT